MRVAWLLMLSGCWLTDAEIVDRYDGSIPDPDSDIPDDVVTTEIVGMTPTFGTDAGGTEVTLTVDATAADVEVFFGDVEATIVRTTENTIVVTTPRGNPGGSEVTLTSGGAVVDSPEDYWYWADGEGSFGAIGWLEYTEYVGDFVAIGYVNEVTANIKLVEPTDDGTSTLWGLGLDQCSAVPTEPNQVAIDLMAPDIQIQHGDDGPISLPYDAETESYKAQLDLDDYVSDAWYDLLPPQGDAPFPYFGVENFLRTPSPFRVTSPNFAYDRFLSDRYGADVTGDFDLNWGVSATGDYITVSALRWGYSSSSGWELRERVRCVLEDDGSFTFTSAMWSGWEIGAPLDLYVSRFREPDGTLPHNGATNDVAGRYIVAGTVWQALFPTR